VLIGIAIPGALGYWVEKAFNDEVALVSSDVSEFVSYEVISYDRGWLSSQAEIRIGWSDSYRENLRAVIGREAAAGGDDPEGLYWILDEYISVKAELSHGPLLSEGGKAFGLGYVDAEVQPASPALSDMLERLGMPYLATTNAYMGFSGRSMYEGAVPSFEYDSSGNLLRFAGIQYSGEADPANETLSFDAHVPELSIETLSGDVVVKNIGYDFSLQRLTNGIWLGPGKMSMESMQFTDALDAEALVIEGAAVDVSNAVNEDATKMTFTLLYTIDDIRSDTSFRLQDTSFGVEFRSLDIAALTRLYEFNQQITMGQEVAPEKLRDPVYTLVAASPEMSLRPVSLLYNGEPLTAEFDFRVDGAGLPELESFDPMSEELWNALMSGEAKLALSAPLANVMATEVALSQIRTSLGEAADDVDPVELQELATRQGPVLIEAMVQQGMLKAADEGYESEISFQNGQMILNGTVIPLGNL